MKPTIIQLIAFLYRAAFAAAFSAPTSAAPWQTFLDNLFQSPNSKTSNNEATQLKQKLINECRQNIGACNPQIRSNIESIMDDLAPYNPTPNTATSALLRREWILEWTSEKEINFFLEKGLSDEIVQTLTPSSTDSDSSGSGVLENYIPFVKGGGFGVTGEISVDEEEQPQSNDNNDGQLKLVRTKFKFKNANLNLGKWGEYNFPPVGGGWFDTIYLDESLRIDTNSRNDILICRADGSTII